MHLPALVEPNPFGHSNLDRKLKETQRPVNRLGIFNVTQRKQNTVKKMPEGNCTRWNLNKHAGFYLNLVYNDNFLRSLLNLLVARLVCRGCFFLRLPSFTQPVVPSLGKSKLMQDTVENFGLLQQPGMKWGSSYRTENNQIPFFQETLLAKVLS